MIRTTVVVASGNPVKLEAARRGFETMLPGRDLRLETLRVRSGVPDQPRGDAETRLGAENRAEGAARRRPEAGFWVGIEGGVEDGPDGMTPFAWVVVRSADRAGASRTATFHVPPAVAELVREGRELGEADDLVFGTEDSKRREGAVGLLTEGAVTRAGLYEQAVALALIPFRNEQLFASDTTAPA